jgi:hypothetical protein
VGRVRCDEDESGDAVRVAEGELDA